MPSAVRTCIPLHTSGCCGVDFHPELIGSGGILSAVSWCDAAACEDLSRPYDGDGDNYNKMQISIAVSCRVYVSSLSGGFCSVLPLQRLLKV